MPLVDPAGDHVIRGAEYVDPLRCPACGGDMRVVAFITHRAVIDRNLDRLRRGRASAHGPPSAQSGVCARCTSERLTPLTAWFVVAVA